MQTTRNLGKYIRHAVPKPAKQGPFEAYCKYENRQVAMAAVFRDLSLLTPDVPLTHFEQALRQQEGKSDMAHLMTDCLINEYQIPIEGSTLTIYTPNTPDRSKWCPKSVLASENIFANVQVSGMVGAGKSSFAELAGPRFEAWSKDSDRLYHLDALTVADQGESEAMEMGFAASEVDIELWMRLKKKQSKDPAEFTSIRDRTLYDALAFAKNPAQLHAEDHVYRRITQETTPSCIIVLIPKGGREELFERIKHRNPNYVGKNDTEYLYGSEEAYWRYANWLGCHLECYRCLAVPTFYVEVGMIKHPLKVVNEVINFICKEEMQVVKQRLGRFSVHLDTDFFNFCDSLVMETISYCSKSAVDPNIMLANTIRTLQYLLNTSGKILDMKTIAWNSLLSDVMYKKKFTHGGLSLRTLVCALEVEAPDKITKALSMYLVEKQHVDKGDITFTLTEMFIKEQMIGRLKEEDIFSEMFTYTEAREAACVIFAKLKLEGVFCYERCDVLRYLPYLVFKQCESIGRIGKPLPEKDEIDGEDKGEKETLKMACDALDKVLNTSLEDWVKNGKKIV